MGGTAVAVAQDRRRPRSLLASFVWIVEVVLFGVLPAVLLAKLAHDIMTGPLPHDFAVFFRAGDAVLNGRSPYPAVQALTDDTRYVYPPLLALAVAPLTILSAKAALLCWTVLGLLATAASLRLLGVVDWRCYGIAVMFVPTRESLGLGTVNPFLLLGIALAWRYRSTAGVAAAAALGAVVALKVFLWPLFLWPVIMRRYGSALIAAGVSLLLGLGSWAVIGFAGLADYPALLRKLSRIEAETSFSPYGVLRTAGATNAVAFAITTLAGALLLLGAFWLSRRSDHRRADRVVLGCCVVAALVMSPIVWWHYFVLLLVPIALARPRFSGLWLLPFATALLPLVGHPVASPPNEAAYPLAVAGVLTALVLAVTTRGFSSVAVDSGAERG